MSKIKDESVKVESNQLRLVSQSKTEQNDVLELTYEFTVDLSRHEQLKLENLQEKVGDKPFIFVSIAEAGAGVNGMWLPQMGFQKNLYADWMIPRRPVNLSHSAPVVTFYDQNSRNIYTFACSELARDNWMSCGVHEETGELMVQDVIALETSFVSSHQNYILKLYLDKRKQTLSSVLGDVTAWWDHLLPDQPAHVPQTARIPMYSTWYSYHQNLDDQALRAEYEQAAQMGMKTVLIDDGWQTSDLNRGYAYCGDWEVCKEKFPDFADHVRYIHSLGMKCIVWFGFPFMGRYSKAWEQFKDKLLHYESVWKNGVLDPRYAEVRNYLITTFVQFVEKWDVDGLKLDFIDSFRNYEDTPPYYEGMDYAEIQDAVYALMIEAYQKLNAVKPEFMIEFRQTYIGPKMRRFGNLFRVGDCPLSGVSNRVGAADLRMLSGNTAVHSDMLMWHKDETPEDVAIRMINSIFSTYQISVRLCESDARVKQVLQYYLDFSIKYEKVLQEGKFEVYSPILNYPILEASKGNIAITARYDENIVVPQKDEVNEWWILNGCRNSCIPVRIIQEGTYQMESYDCFGNPTDCRREYVKQGVHELMSSAGGSVCLNLVSLL